MAWQFYLKNLPFEFIDDMCFSFNRKLKRRPSSAPFLSGDTYRSIADFLFDDSAKCSAEEINSFTKSKISGERIRPVIFVSSWKLKDFSEMVLPGIKREFVMITHQGDVNIMSEEHKKILKNKFLVHWFAQNNIIKNKKITCLPIGLEDAWKHNAGTISDFKKGKFASNEKEPKILYGFSVGTNPEKRGACLMALARNKNAKEIRRPPCPHLYREMLSKCMFVASPSGNGFDCHRTWEAIYFGVVPVLEDNEMNRSFKKLGLPVLLLKNDDWTSLNAWTPEKMKGIYEKIISEGKTEAAYFDFWKEKIEAQCR